MLRRFFGQPKRSPDELAKEWRRQLQSEQRKLDRQIRAIQQEERKLTASMRKVASDGMDMGTLKMMARQLIKSRKVVTRLEIAKAQMNSVCMELQHMVSTLRHAEAMKSSTQITASINSMVRIPEVRALAHDLSVEMTKNGLVSEMVEDNMASVFDDDIPEEELNTETDRVIEEVLSKQLQGTHVATGGLIEPQIAEEQEQENDALRERLDMMKTM